MKKMIYALGFTLLVVGCGGNGGGGNDNNGAQPGPAATTSLTAIDNSCIAGGVTSVCNNSIYGQYNGWYAYPNQNLQNYYQNGVYNFCGCPAGTIPAYGTTAGLGCVTYSMVPNNAYQWSLGSGYNWAYAQGSFNQSVYINLYSQNYYGNYDHNFDPRPYNGGHSYRLRGFGDKGGFYYGRGGYYRGNKWYGVSASFNNAGVQYAPSSNNSVNLPQIPNTTNTYNNRSSSCSNSNVVQSCFANQPNSCGNGAQCIVTNGGTGIGICANPNSGTGSITGGTR